MEYRQLGTAGAWMRQWRIGVVRRRTADLSQAQQATLRYRRLRADRNISAAFDDGIPVNATAMNLPYLACEPRSLGKRARNVGVCGGDRFVFGHCVSVSARDLGNCWRLERLVGFERR